MKRKLDFLISAMLVLNLGSIVLYKYNAFWNFFYFFRTDLLLVFLLCFIYLKAHKSPYVLSGILCYLSYIVFDFGTLLGWSVFSFLLKMSLTLILSTTLIYTVWHIYRKR